MTDAPDDAAVQSLVREILARPEYAQFRASDPAWLRAIGRWFADLLDRLNLLRDTSPLLFALLLVGLTVLALGLLAHVIWAVRVAFAATVPQAPPRSARGERDLAGEALGLAREGRFLEAAHGMQLACLAALLRSGGIELQRHEPNRTLRARLARAPLPERERREFLALLARLEVRWFRDRAPDAADRELFAAWRDLHGRLRVAASAT